MSMEFVMGNSLEALPKTIDFNFEELKAQLASSLELYTGLVVTEDGIKSAKEDRAKLNKLREALETKRKEVKKECMAPYTDFEVKVKELVGLIDKPIAAIDGQLKTYEEKRRAYKRAAVLAVYEDTIGELRSLLPFERLWQDAWYNTSVSMKKIREAIVSAEAKATSDLEVLATVESEFSEPVKLKYLETLDLNAALAERARLQEQAKRLREFEERRASAEKFHEKVCDNFPMPDPLTEPHRSPVDGPIPQSAAFTDTPPLETEAVYRLCFECKVTMKQARELSDWLKARNIQFRRV